MLNFAARTEIHDAWTNIVLADALLERGEYDAAKQVMRDAESHFRSAQTGVIIEQSDSLKDKLADLRIKLDRLRSAIRMKSGVLERHAAQGQ